MAPYTSHRLEEPGQIRALASPARLQVVSALEALGTVSVRELAAHLGRSPESLYFHLQKLIEVGLVETAGERPTARRPERLVRLVADRLRLAAPLDEAPARDALAAICRAVTRATERDYGRGLESGGARLEGPGRNLALHHYHVHLKAADRRRLVQLLEELTAFLIEHNDPERGALYSFTSVLSPVAPRPGDEPESSHAS